MADKKKAGGRPPRNRNQLLFEFDMQREASQDVRQYFVGTAYPPCTKPMSELEPIILADLQLETHHRDQVLFVRTVDEGIRAAAIQTIIEDDSGAVERLAVYNAYALAEATDLMTKGTVLAVKEPFFEATTAGNFCIRIDHPSDIVFLTASDTRLPEALRSSGDESQRSVVNWKAEGNRFYKEDKFTDAVRAFTSGLTSCGPSDTRVACDILRNRAITNTYLKRFEDALADGKAAVIPADGQANTEIATLNAKSHFRAGRAAYELRDFQEAKQQFEEALKLAPQDGDAARELQRTANRLDEAAKGSYDFAKMGELVSKRRNRLDHADFLENAVKRDAGNHGRGLFSLRPIAAGEAVVCEKAFAVAFDSDPGLQDFALLDSTSQRRLSGTQALLLFNVVAKTLSNPGKAREFFELHDGGYAFNSPVQTVDESPVVDTFRAQAVLAHNTYGCPTVKTTSKVAQRQAKSAGGYTSTGLWSTMSLVNHACNGNAMRSFIGDMMVLRATRDIAKDEEILMPYRLPGPDNDVTQDELQKIWGFRCDCSICLAETKIPLSQRRQRSQLLKECADLLSANAISEAKPPTKKLIARVERLFERLEKTYDSQTFQLKPRLGLVAPGMWLCHAYAILKLWSKLADNALGSLRNLGFIVTVSDDGHSFSVERAECLLVDDAIDAAIFAARAWGNLKKIDPQGQMHSLATSLYEILNGDRQGFEEKISTL